MQQLSIQVTSKWLTRIYVLYLDYKTLRPVGYGSAVLSIIGIKLPNTTDDKETHLSEVVAQPTELVGASYS